MCVCVCVCVCAHTCLVIESCPTLCEPKDCSLPELQSKKPELGVNRNISKATTTNLYPRLHLLLLLLHFFFSLSPLNTIQMRIPTEL